jgi:hypothetical protein
MAWGMILAIFAGVEKKAEVVGSTRVGSGCGSEKSKASGATAIMGGDERRVLGSCRRKWGTE